MKQIIADRMEMERNQRLAAAAAVAASSGSHIQNASQNQSSAPSGQGSLQHPLTEIMTTGILVFRLWATGYRLLST